MPAKKDDIIDPRAQGEAAQIDSSAATFRHMLQIGKFLARLAGHAVGLDDGRIGEALGKVGEKAARRDSSSGRRRIG